MEVNVKYVAITAIIALAVAFVYDYAKKNMLAIKS
jgi:hypothetical protein